MWSFAILKRYLINLLFFYKKGIDQLVFVVSFKAATNINLMEKISFFDFENLCFAYSLHMCFSAIRYINQLFDSLFAIGTA